MSVRPLGTMIAFGYPTLSVQSELDLAESIGAFILEILPDWKSYPNPRLLRRAASDRGFQLRSAHGCWGGQSIKARRVDLGSTDPLVHRESVDDLWRCIDWLEAAGGTHLVVHPGGLSDPDESQQRRDQLGRGLLELGDHASGGGIVICVENMPQGVFPGCMMVELHELLVDLAHPALALALDTGHAHMSVNAVSETVAAGSLLATTHVHDNDGRRDSHDPPGWGTVPWADWIRALDEIGYEGPVVLECIRQIRENPSRYRRDVVEPLLAGSAGS
ncbi:sugar phosphate isomerase/epimerase family protein [Aquisphaera insulae]|uniref:sugar phosphate isomerase/epimerase family protein n=1 Tax=Aquisphaera insulae TaxID=2712864 RepID=UPI0013ED3EA7|nr:sugar phosphate isomerase/epimerase family protein [Aquisphaera insulae]